MEAVLVDLSDEDTVQHYTKVRIESSDVWIPIGLNGIKRCCAAFTRMMCFSSVIPEVVNDTPRFTDDSTFRSGSPDRKNVEV